MNRSTRELRAEFSNGLTIDSYLHKEAVVTKSVAELPNSALFTVFGLSKESVLKLDEQPTIKIFLNDKLFYSGRVINSTYIYNGIDWKTTLYCNDITLMPTATKQYISIPSGTPKQKAIETLTEKIGSPQIINYEEFKKCKKSDASLAKQFKTAYTKEEDIMKAVNNMFKDCGTTAVKEDGKVKLISRDVGYKKTVTNSKRVSKTATVPNIGNPLIFKNLFDAPRVSTDDIVVNMVATDTPKLGLGFKVFAKSYQQNLKKPFVLKEKFEDKVYRIIEIVHRVDNYSTYVASTQVRGEYVR